MTDQTTDTVKVEPDRANPFMMALVYITLIAAFVGVVLAFIGGSAGPYGPAFLLVWGLGLIGFALTALLVALGAAAARWKP
jgi:threonine dehydrogenase-like Zn-dependent dehydrogenase